MNNSDIKTILTDLKVEARKIEPNDPSKVESINQLIKKLEQKIEGPEIDDDNSLPHHMQSMIEQFETSHPRITLIINDLMVKLAGMSV